MYKNLELDKLGKSVEKGERLSYRIFFSSKTQKSDIPFRVIISEKGTWQKQIATYLLDTLYSDYLRFEILFL